MITPGDLLDFAAFDLTSINSEAAVRRAISSAYYAAFHAVAHAGASRFNGSERLRQRLARSYDHGAVRAMAGEMDRFSKRPGADPDFASVAANLLALREARETADYDLLVDLTWTDGFDAIAQAAEVLRCVARLQGDPAFDDLLLLPLIRDRSRRG